METVDNVRDTVKMSSKKEMEDLVRKLRKLGYQVEDAGRRYKVRCPNGLYVLAKTPSASNSVKKSISGLRRMGVKI